MNAVFWALWASFRMYRDRLLAAGNVAMGVADNVAIGGVFDEKISHLIIGESFPKCVDPTVRNAHMFKTISDNYYADWRIQRCVLVEANWIIAFRVDCTDCVRVRVFQGHRKSLFCCIGGIIQALLASEQHEKRGLRAKASPRGFHRAWRDGRDSVSTRHRVTMLRQYRRSRWSSQLLDQKAS